MFSVNTSHPVHQLPQIPHAGLLILYVDYTRSLRTYRITTAVHRELITRQVSHATQSDKHHYNDTTM